MASIGTIGLETEEVREKDEKDSWKTTIFKTLTVKMKRKMYFFFGSLLSMNLWHQKTVFIFS